MCVCVCVLLGGPRFCSAKPVPGAAIFEPKPAKLDWIQETIIPVQRPAVILVHPHLPPHAHTHPYTHTPSVHGPQQRANTG